MRYRIKSRTPKRSQRVFVMGPPGAGRSTVARLLADKYGFAFVSTANLIHSQIEEKSELAEQAFQAIMNGELRMFSLPSSHVSPLNSS
jgi:adenylate kinase family enzyme